MNFPSETAFTLSGLESLHAVRPVVFFSNRTDWTDVVLVAKGREFHFSRAQLCITSPVFKAMLTQNFKEKNAERIELPNDDPSVLEEFLRLLSPKHQHNLTEQNMATILPIANKYEVTHILEYIEEYLIELLPEKFGFYKPEEFLCCHTLIADISKKLCEVDLGNWLKACNYHSRVHVIPFPWWCGLLVLYHVAKECNFSKLKKTVWEKLMCTSSSSVWLSSVGQNFAVDLPPPRVSPFLKREKSEQSKRDSNQVKFKPIHFECAKDLCTDKSEKLKTRFVLLGVKTMPFFTSLDAEEKIDLLLSFNTFQATCVL